MIPFVMNFRGTNFFWCPGKPDQSKGQDMNMFFATVAAVLLSLFTPQANADNTRRSEPNYVGGGRYVCHDKTVGCALIKQNNRRITQEQIERTYSKRLIPSSERRESSLKPPKGNERYRSRLSSDR